MNRQKYLNWFLIIASVLIALLALTPQKWGDNLSVWYYSLNVVGMPFLLGLLLIGLVLTLIRVTNNVQILPTRKEWVDRHLTQIIKQSEKIVFVTSYEGNKHPFWHELEQRMYDDKPFDFIYLSLPLDDPILHSCVRNSGGNMEVAAFDKEVMEKIIQKCKDLPHRNRKSVRHLYWKGESQGPMISWVIKGKETIATGLWQQVPGNTDLSPWIITRRGHLFNSLKSHYENLIAKA